MNAECPEETIISGSDTRSESSSQPPVLLVDLGNVRDVTLGFGGNQAKDGKYFYA